MSVYQHHAIGSAAIHDGLRSECPLCNPSLPYAGTEGNAGSSTSEERARREAVDGTASARQQAVLSWLLARGAYGATWQEVAEWFGWHHGQASGSLSALHKEGRLARLTERRGRSQVYVRPSWVQGRDTVPQGRRTPDPVIVLFTRSDADAATATAITDEEYERIVKAIEFSSIPEAFIEVVWSVVEQRDEKEE